MTDLLPSLTQTPVAAKLTALRSHLSNHNLDAYLIPSADEHLNEYLPELKQRRKWISGFTGSAGDFLVGREKSWLYADSRYYEQADLEVDPALIQVVKVGLDGQQTLEETLEALGQEAAKAGNVFRVGYDPFTVSVQQFRDLQKRLEPFGVSLEAVSENWVDVVRSQRPWSELETPSDYAQSPLFQVPDALTGEALPDKLKRLREKLQQANADVLPITKLDQIAWLFNLRGWDVPYNPVFIAYAIATTDKTYLFTTLSRIESNIQQALEPYVKLMPYAYYAGTLTSLLSPSTRVLVDPKHTTMGTYRLLKRSTTHERCKILEGTNPIEGMKARKNATEIAQMYAANLKASRAKTRTMKWVQEQIAIGATVTEADVAATIEGYYQAEAAFQGLSFNTIAGSGANSSIVHYGTPNPEAVLKSGDLLLLDSGAQYAGGTTDDTRTIAIGTPTPEQINRYTEVLKAHINCAMQKFPKGTTGAQLDGITRSTLWHHQLDFGHGTGHGVGAFLNVHEGPNGISKRVNEALEPGMINSIEPGFYEPGWGGIRIENLYVVQEVPQTTEPDAKLQTSWYYFDSLTYIPFDKHLIDASRLNACQREWLDRYHQAILTKLSPTLNPDEVTWLTSACQL
jgi:Xaa-Pro aminopeptidase